MEIPQNLIEIADRLKEPNSTKHAETVRTILSWFGSHRRGFNKVAQIRTALKELGLTTFPDFESTYIDGLVEFRSSVPWPKDADDAVIHENDNEIEGDFDLIDPVPRLSLLQAANRAPIAVNQHADVKAAITLMLTYDFSQLPVMQGERSVKGYISWATIGRARAFHSKCDLVSDCMETEAPIMRANKPLFEAVGVIASKGFVLVQDDTNCISGLVTTSDISLQFHELAEPFLVIGQIERNLRRLLAKSFSLEELRCALNPAASGREIHSVASFTFGEYVRFLQGPGNWQHLSANLDGKIVLEQLERVRMLRNDVMHFHPDPIEVQDLELLRGVARLLQQLSD